MSNITNNTSVPFENYPDVLTMEQLQNALNVGRSTAYALVRTGEIRSFRIGTAIRVPKESINSYIQSSLTPCYNETRSGQANSGCQEGVYVL